MVHFILITGSIQYLEAPMSQQTFLVFYTWHQWVRLILNELTTVLLFWTHFGDKSAHLNVVYL